MHRTGVEGPPPPKPAGKQSGSPGRLLPGLRGTASRSRIQSTTSSVMGACIRVSACSIVVDGVGSALLAGMVVAHASEGVVGGGEIHAVSRRKSRRRADGEPRRRNARAARATNNAWHHCSLDLKSSDTRTNYEIKFKIQFFILYLCIFRFFGFLLLFLLCALNHTTQHMLRAHTPHSAPHLLLSLCYALVTMLAWCVCLCVCV